MTDKRPPSLGAYRPSQDDEPTPARERTGRTQRPSESQPQQDARDPTRVGPLPTDDGLPRIITARVPDARTAPPRTRPASRRPRPEPASEGMSVVRVLTYSLLGLVVFVVAAAAAAIAFVPTDVIRSRVAQEVKARTGRDLDIAERPSLSFWPRPAVTLRKVTLSAPAAMGGAPLLVVGEIDLAVKLLPLLLRDVSIDTLVLKRPVVDLVVDAQGRRNWDFADAGLFTRPIQFAQAAPAGGKTMPKELQDFVKNSNDAQVNPQATGGGQKQARFTDLTLANVAVIDGQLRYRDLRSGVDEHVSRMTANFSLANIASPLEAKGDLVWRGEPVAMTAQISPFRALMEGRPVQTNVQATAAPLSLTYAGTAALQPELDLDGRVTLKAAALDKLARWTGRSVTGSLPGGLALEGKVRQSTGVTSIADGRLTLGPLTGSGTLSLEHRAPKPYVKGALHLAALDFNMLRALGEGAAVATPAATAPAATAPAAVPAAKPTAPTSIEDLLKSTAEPTPAAPKAPPQVRGFNKREGWSDERIDLSALGLADADVKLGFDKVVWDDVVTGQGQVTLSIKGKQAKATLDDMRLYDGQARGIVTIDTTAAEPTVGGNIVADGVSSLPMFKALSGFDWLSGRARVAIAVAGRGATERQIVSTLNGKADIALTDGALIGFDFLALIKSFQQGRIPSFERQPNNKTDFSEFAASAQIANGIARNTDLRVASAQLTATGAGTIDLPQRTMDYALKPKVPPNFEIPLKVQGSLDKPTVTPDVGGLLRDPNGAVQAIQDAAKTPAGREVQETVKGLLNGDPNARAKAKGFLDQFLKQ